MIEHEQIQNVIKQDIPQLLACGGIFSFCTLTNIATVMQAIGVIAAGIGALVIVAHRLFAFLRDINK